MGFLVLADSLRPARLQAKRVTLLSLGRQNFLNADLINEVLSSYVSQMGSFFLVRQGCSDAPGHRHYERLVIHAHPKSAGSRSGPPSWPTSDGRGPPRDLLNHTVWHAVARPAP